tara:strand:+ start:432 stop:1031 length:600 start_codon:yes stop_codon:yes gene_type:complete
MFTGIAEGLGEVSYLEKKDDIIRLEVVHSLNLDDLDVNDSISLSGICLTVVQVSENRFQVEMVPETISKTTAKYWEIGSKLNLERAMLQTTRMGGHFLQGHVDAVIRILKIVEYENSALFTLEIEDSLIKYIVEKGYVGIDGLSLTVAKKYSNSIDIALIPHTLSITNFSSKNENDNVNLEVDMIAKYVENFTKPHINQ